MEIFVENYVKQVEILTQLKKDNVLFESNQQWHCTQVSQQSKTHQVVLYLIIDFDKDQELLFLLKYGEYV